jgi:hypothetical protein
MLTDEQCDHRDAAILDAIDAVQSWRISGPAATAFVMTLARHGWDIRPLNAPASERERGMMKELHDVEQVLGMALGYPWYKDDQKNFPGAIDADGVCVGEHVPATIAAEAADGIQMLRRALERINAMPNYNPSDILIPERSESLLARYQQVLRIAATSIGYTGTARAVIQAAQP